MWQFSLIRSRQKNRPRGPYSYASYASTCSYATELDDSMYIIAIDVALAFTFLFVFCLYLPPASSGRTYVSVFVFCVNGVFILIYFAICWMFEIELIISSRDINIMSVIVICICILNRGCIHSYPALLGALRCNNCMKIVLVAFIFRSYVTWSPAMTYRASAAVLRPQLVHKTQELSHSALSGHSLEL